MAGTFWSRFIPSIHTPQTNERHQGGTSHKPSNRLHSSLPECDHLFDAVCNLRIFIVELGVAEHLVDALQSADHKRPYHRKTEQPLDNFLNQSIVCLLVQEENNCKCAQYCLPGEIQHIPHGIAAFPDRRNDDDRHQHTGKSDVSQRLRFSVRFFISAAQNGI